MFAVETRLHEVRVGAVVAGSVRPCSREWHHTPICESFINLGCPCLDVRVTRTVKAVALHRVYVWAVAKERPDVGCETDRHARNSPTLCVVVDRGNLHLDLVRVRDLTEGPERKHRGAGPQQ